MLNRISSWIRKTLRNLLKVDAEVTAAQNEVRTAAEMIIEDFTEKRDEQAEMAVTLYDEGADQVDEGTKKMRKGAQNLAYARTLGSNRELPRR